MVISTFLCSQVPSARFDGDHALDAAIADAVDLIDQIRQDAGVIRDDGDLVADLKGQRFVALDEAVLLIELGDADLGMADDPAVAGAVAAEVGGERFAAGVDDGMDGRPSCRQRC